MNRRGARPGLVGLLLTAVLVAPTAAHEPNPVERLLGRAESRVRSAPFEIRVGSDLGVLGLPRRLERLGYTRVHRRPRAVGEYFWGHEVFWVYQRPWRHRGDDRPGGLVGLSIDRGSGRILGVLGASGDALPDRVWSVEPETLAEDLEAARARRVPVSVRRLPEHVWLAVLAAEDHRFFGHEGVDPRSIARALVTNLRAGGVRQGGSTITQQLIKNRDLTPQRTLGRKVSEAARALALEADHDKQDILEAYLNSVYLGHVDGQALHGFGAAARAFFDRRAVELSLAEAATLAGVIRSPNRLSPLRHPEAARERRDVVLGRLEELGWIPTGEVAAARQAPLRTRPVAPPEREASAFLAWIGDEVRKEEARRLEKGRGVVVETTLDPYLQERARQELREAAEGLAGRGRTPELALVALDATDGSVLAFVGGVSDSQFDRARSAARQPGSAIKPLVLLEAFQDCGPHEPLHPASRVADEPLRIELESGAWEPRNDDRSFRGPIEIREALADSRNVPFARLARWCGFEETADRLRRTGLDLPSPAPPAFALGAVETSPLDLASAYTVLATPGDRLAPRPWVRLERPAGRRLGRRRRQTRRVVEPATAWLIKDLLRSAVEEGTARGIDAGASPVWAKTGTSSGSRDAWMAGVAGRTVLVLWAGHDDGTSLGFGGARLGETWGRIAEVAAALRPAEPGSDDLPAGVVERWVDPRTGLLVRSWTPGARREVFRRGTVPRRDRFWRSDAPENVIR